MLSAFMLPRERVDYAMVAFLSERCLSSPESTGFLRAAAQSRAGWVPLHRRRYV